MPEDPFLEDEAQRNSTWEDWNEALLSFVRDHTHNSILGGLEWGSAILRARPRIERRLA